MNSAVREAFGFSKAGHRGLCASHSDGQVAQIAASIREWGWTNPVLVAEDGTIIAGHGRVLAARARDP